jgi:phosphoribosylformimino-5-aminoimidazole carboxamide ribotide isomerase
VIIPCIDLMEGKAVQLVQGRDKALERSADEMVDLFRGFEQIQVIDLDAAMGRGSNNDQVVDLAQRATIRVGGGVRSVERARELLGLGAFRVTVGTAAFSKNGPNFSFLRELAAEVGAENLTIALDSRNGHIVIDGWRHETEWTAARTVPELEPYCSSFLCTYVDKEGMMQGTDLAWFESLRQTTSREIIAAGGITTLEDIQALSAVGVHCAIGMSIYTGRLSLDELRAFNTSLLPRAHHESHIVPKTNTN